MKIGKKWRNKVAEALVRGIFIAAGVVICLPVFLVVTGSVMGDSDLRECLAPVFLQEQGFTTWKIIPDYPTLENYNRLLFKSPQFFVLFWNSIKIVFFILAGQMLVGVPAAWAFAVYRVRGKNLLFTLYVVLMLLPFQVTMLSSYLILNRMALLNTQWAVILPAVFNTFPIFVTYGGFCAIPKPLIEAARIDGAGEFYIFVKIGLALGKGGILSAVVLGFLEYWNMIEQPLTFLKDKFLWPLSLYLPEIEWTQAGFAFSASVIMLVPAVFVFVMGQDYLEQGIVYSGLK
ncbi:MAG: carbohydrate ABC transporter permease [Lachnoclostridium sp.]|nr:carbohydrate ABC transporter permease [Lachnospira sp.]MCM1246890.1 carbohydrate ABC transporter permease [Lachnoclostridium sp.]